MHKAPYIRPEIISYAHHAFPLGIIKTVPESIDWILSNYIYIYYKEAEDYPIFNFVVTYRDNPFIDIRNIYKDEFICLCNQFGGLSEWILSELNKNYVVEIMVDYFYLSTSSFYQQEHSMHEILITGYSDKNEFYLWDYSGIYKEFCCKNDEVVPFDAETFYGDSVIARVYKSSQGNFVFNENVVWQQIEDYYMSKNIYANIAIWGNYDGLKKCTFGFSCLAELIESVKNSLGIIDYRFINVFYEHKRCMRMRLERLMQEKDWLLVEEWRDLENRWRKLLLYILKYNSYVESGRYTEDRHNEIISKLIVLQEDEKKELEKLLSVRLAR